MRSKKESEIVIKVSQHGKPGSPNAGGWGRERRKEGMRRRVSLTFSPYGQCRASFSSFYRECRGLRIKTLLSSQMFRV